jgi:Small Multidrug Resistance protein
MFVSGSANGHQYPLHSVIRPGALLRGDVGNQALPGPEEKLVSKEMPQKRSSRTRACRTRPAKTTVSRWLGHRGLVGPGYFWVVGVGLGGCAQSVCRFHPSAGVRGLRRCPVVQHDWTRLSLRTIPVATGYAVWVGIGVTGTALAGMLFFGESASVTRALSLLLVLAGIIGLKLFH